MFDEELMTKAASVIAACRASGVRLCVVEASTGGLLTGLLTLIPGASAVIDRSAVVYSNESKTLFLGASLEVFLQHGSVSAEAVEEMVRAGLQIAPDAGLCVAVSGVEGPGSTSATKPAGLVHLAVRKAGASGALREERRFGDVGRTEVRRASLLAAMDLVLRSLR